jgi:hypothetical protein
MDTEGAVDLQGNLDLLHAEFCKIPTAPAVLKPT